MRIRRLVFTTTLVAAAGCNLLTGASGLGFDEPPPPVPPADPDTGVIANLPESGPTVDGGAPTDASVQDVVRDVRADGDAGPVANAKRVFVTSTKTDGNMNGFVEGDQLCTTLATAESLGGTWVAWLSIQDAQDAVDRLTHDGPWYLVDRSTLAISSRAQLTALGGIAHEIDRDEKGGAVPNDEVWTGTRAGRFFQNDCVKWTNALFNGGQFGRTNATNVNWTSANAGVCGQMRRLYCFEN